MSAAAPPYDLAIVGGGINGAGIARDAAGRGFRVLLVEQGDLGGATSSASTGLIHGGLRYLEHGELRLVRESLAERETLLRIAPHLVRPLEFVLPHEPHLRPAWVIRAGLLLYDHLARRRTLPGSRAVRLAGTRYGAGLKSAFARGFAYFDAAVDDARLVLANARAAADLGADIRPRTRCVAARRDGDAWRLDLRNAPDGRAAEARARVLVNAAGPWVRRFLEDAARIASPGAVRLVKGSHVVVPRMYEGDHAYLLQNADGRVVFLLPYEDAYTAIGTTDVPVAAPEDARIDRAEVDYLCAVASRYAARAVDAGAVVHAWSGIRPLFDDGSADPAAITRDYHFVLDDAGAPLLSIHGGKLTTYRRLAEAALRRLGRWLPDRPSRTAAAPLPGGDCDGDFAALVAACLARYPGLDAAWLRRLLRRHGSCAPDVLGDARTPADLGAAFGGGLYAREIEYLRRREWAMTVGDVLWRRTKAGLHFDPAARERLASATGLVLD
jgi:glycerol-3-phosphate dehydrogenase